MFASQMSCNYADEFTISTPTPVQLDPSLFDIGHQGGFDRPQIATRPAMRPTERLGHHEFWRLFVKEALKRAEIRRNNRGSAR
jgi:hypothetical protein